MRGLVDETDALVLRVPFRFRIIGLFMFAVRTLALPLWIVLPAAFGNHTSRLDADGVLARIYPWDRRRTRDGERLAAAVGRYSGGTVPTLDARPPRDDEPTPEPAPVPHRVYRAAPRNLVLPAALLPVAVGVGWLARVGGLFSVGMVALYLVLAAVALTVRLRGRTVLDGPRPACGVPHRRPPGGLRRVAAVSSSTGRGRTGSGGPAPSSRPARPTPASDRPPTPLDDSSPTANRETGTATPTRRRVTAG